MTGWLTTVVTIDSRGTSFAREVSYIRYPASSLDLYTERDLLQRHYNSTLHNYCEYKYSAKLLIIGRIIWYKGMRSELLANGLIARFQLP